MSKTARNPWLDRTRSCPSAWLRLFCLPYAGGSAAIFRNWTDSLPPFIEVCCIQLPGRGARLREQPFTSMSLLVGAIEMAISEYLDKPFAFFGHSMGAAISFELTHKIRSKRGLEPVHLFVSGRRAPQLVRTDASTFKLPEHEFTQELRRLEGTPQEVFENQELLKLFLPLLRSDFELIQTAKYVARPQLKCPITALGGIADNTVSREDLQAWSKQTSGRLNLCLLPGNHFFLHQYEPRVLQVIAEQLGALALLLLQP
jgi:medium-chain acyl-[acyl-carrier-protein] hydrolase